jgi:quinohemoprotein ethanol dehydrogenase
MKSFRFEAAIYLDAALNAIVELGKGIASQRFISMLVMAAGLLAMPAIVTPQSDDYKSSSADWPLVHGNWQNQRYSNLSQINTNTVKNLGGVWVSKKFEDGASTRSSPVVKDRMMYVNAGARVYALNAKTGETVWAWSSRVLPSFQGVAVGEGKVFVGLTNGHVAALDQKTGVVIWNQPIGADPPQKGESVTGAPTYANGMVFAGLANGDWALRGRVVALDAKTGRELWHFFTIAGPGEVGYDTWQVNNDIWKIGGAGVWQTGTIDPDLGTVYFATGNAVPPFAGEARAGNNLFTVSVLALDMKTGKLRWHYQLVHHDLWEADVATPLVLYDAEIGGRFRKMVAAMRGDGYLFFLDRETGAPILPIEERPVPQDTRMKTSPTQPYPIGADRVLPDCDEWKKEKIPAGFEVGCFFTPAYYDKLNVLRPIFGMRVVPMSYSPQTGYFYTTGIAFLAWKRRTEDPYLLLDPDSSAPGLKSHGVIAAIDSRTDKIVWKKEMTSRGGGSVVTAGKLMFESEADGYFKAYDAMTGEVLWQFQIGMAGGIGSNGGGRGPATTYEIDGDQYIAVPAGTSIWAFKLGGTLQPSPMPNLSAANERFTGPITDTSEVETMSLDQAAVPEGGNRYYIDEYKFNPIRARVKVGTRVVWINNGKMVHTILAEDGSWTTGPISPAQQGYVTFDKPGTYTYICKDHPWVYGQLIVITENDSTGFYTEDQADRGKALYRKSCTVCHTESLGGGDQVPTLVGESFLGHWLGRSVGDLFDRLRTTMPQSNPGNLSEQEYIDIVAYLLKANDFPAGKEELKNSPQSLKSTLIARRK